MNQNFQSKQINMTVILLIIDPQNDFHEGGSLAIPGAMEDTKRIAALVEAHGDDIDEIYVTLDSHHVNIYRSVI